MCGDYVYILVYNIIFAGFLYTAYVILMNGTSRVNVCVCVPPTLLFVVVNGVSGQNIGSARAAADVGRLIRRVRMCASSSSSGRAHRVLQGSATTRARRPKGIRTVERMFMTRRKEKRKFLFSSAATKTAKIFAEDVPPRGGPQMFCHTRIHIIGIIIIIIVLKHV